MNISKKRLWFLSRQSLWIGWALLGTELIAQAPVTVYRQLNADNGLSHNYVTAIEQDQHGFIWIATQFGLHRYDGREVVSYFNDPEDPTSMSSNDVNGIDITIDGQFWIAHYTDGVDHYDPVAEIFTHYTSPNTASWIQADGYGGVWSGGYNGLGYKSATADSFILHAVTRHPWWPSTELPFVRKLYRDRKGTVWVATTRGLYRPAPDGGAGAWFLPREERYRTADTTFVITDLVEDATGRLWAASESGLFYYSPADAGLLPYQGTGAGSRPLAGKHIEAIAVDSAGQLWLSLVAEGLYRLDPRRGDTQFFPLSDRPDEGLFADHILDIFVDHSGVVWLGTVDHGCYRYDPHTRDFTWTRPAKSRSGEAEAEEIIGVLEDARGVVWLVSERGVERIYPAGEDESLPYPATFDAHYPRTKAQAERAVLRANSPALTTCALRPHLIWGPRDRHFLPAFFERQRAGRLRLLSGGPYLVDTTYIDNAARAHVQAFQTMRHRPAAVGGKAYFLSQDDPIPIREFINRLLATGGLPPVAKTLSPRLVLPLAWLLERVYRLFRIRSEPPITLFLAKNLSSDHWFDVSAARRDFGYTPTVSIDEGMERLKAWVRANSA